MVLGGEICLNLCLICLMAAGLVVMDGGLVEGAADVGHEVRAVQQEAGDVLVQDEAVSEC